MISFNAKSLFKPYFFKIICFFIGIFSIHAFCFAADAALKNGKLIEETKCYACHAKKSGLGNGEMIYTRTDHKVTSYSRLKTMVSVCNSELRLDLFPEDEADIVQYLNHQFYHFKNN